ncbi:YIEGIA domain-containing protein [Hazenella sp. IB182357]|uniref:YIEGIA domain-containing protein n=1 Tax=Polycladospora coralii TaxID=2771432 RepID=A0A926RSP2_9BACL|nr:YIEGIA family protein [Polycladospora coralii]MBD1371640.1 YIEGIA domain-containing protein [Polycladospora coralii]MBS7529107.1 YIEGIA family protein [Polycladospora coralii]
MEFENFTWAVIIGILIGFLTRLRMLRADYRQYPTYPHGQIIHLALGLIASALGAIAIPALLQKDYTAITFLTVAAQQFRDVRNMERETLSKLDQMELVQRGATYIEGIAMVFEGRNYLVIFTAALTTFAAVISDRWWVGVATGIFLLAISGIVKSGKVLKDIARVKGGQLRVEGPSLYVDDIYLMNIGLAANREIILQQGVGLIVEPVDISAKVTISNIGQRQAILHDASISMGVYRDTGEPALIPISKRDLKSGRLGVLLLPNDQDLQKAIRVVSEVPVLESAVRKPAQYP